MQGKIIKGIAGFYYVHIPGKGVYECKAKGVFRNQKIKPLVGDNVEIKILNDNEFLGNIEDILPRNNELIRPAVSNIDQALVVFAITDPKPNFNLLDRFIIMMERQGVESIICFSKKDLVTGQEEKELSNIYKNSNCRVLFISNFSEDNEDTVYNELLGLLEGKTTALAGPSGVGKSTLLNRIVPQANMETGEISEKIKRGRHTTRHSEIFHVSGNTYLLDTPGFTSIYLNDFDKDEIKDYFPEFEEHAQSCKFIGCVHINEPSCGVKQAVNEGIISNTRYENYKNIYEEVKSIRRY